MHHFALHNGSRFTKYILPYLTIILTVLVFLTFYIAIKTQSNLIDNCKDNGNPLREGVQKLLENDEHRLHKEIIQNKQVDYKKLFPTYPPHKLEELIANKLAELYNELKDTKELREINKPIDCDSRF